MDVSSIANLNELAVQNALNREAAAVIAGATTKNLSQPKELAQEFASFLYLEVLKAMRAALPQNGLFETDSSTRDLYTSMMDAEIARVMAKHDDTGLTKMVEQSLENSLAKLQDTVEMKLPTRGIISSNFGLRRDPIDASVKFHEGIDIAAAEGKSVSATVAGRVTFSGSIAGYGNVIEVDHGDGVTTRYAHNSKNLVAAGDDVQAGQVIALVGSTGHSTGPHLHFEVRRGGRAIDPTVFLRSNVKGAKYQSFV